MLFTAGAGDFVFIDVRFHFVVRPAVYDNIKVVFAYVVLDKLVGAETLLTFLTVHKRVGEVTDVAGRNPD